uniref:Thioredoxin domain-containing protein n=1 Tax=viral metagenome TaxID=1070528 RepID=A0A6C0KTW7_9ZZZZ
MALPKIETINDLNSILNDNKNVIIEVYATWCEPCRHIAPFFYEMAHANKHVLAAKCNCDDAEEVVRKLGITSIPTFIKFENGKQVAIVYGPEKEEIRRLFMDKASL